MKILYCNKYNFQFSGTETYLFETMELVRSRGHEAALFSMADSRGVATRYDRHFVHVADFKRAAGLVTQARLGMRAVYSVEARKRIASMVEDFRPDVAHVRNIYHHLSPSILWELKAHGVPVLYHVNDFKAICPSYNMVSSSGEACERCLGGKFWNVLGEGCYSGGRAASSVLAAEAYFHRWIGTYRKCVDLVLAPSHFVKSKFVENGWSSTSIQVLPHFQSLSTRATPHPGPAAPILYFGRLSAEKGVQDLLAAMAQLPQVSLNIAGDGPMRGELEAAATKLELKNVSFLGHISGPALQELIAGSQFTIFPSRAYETFGKSILESYAQGRAVIASDLGSRREIVEEGETGILYHVKDANQLAAAIAFLHDRPQLSIQMGEAGRELVRMRHSQEKHFQALISIYDQLAQKGKVPHSVSPQAIVNRTAAARIPAASLRIAYIGGRGIIGRYSGIEAYYEETGSRLAKLGHEVTAYCRNHFTPAVQQYKGIRIVRLPTIQSKHLETLIHTLLSTIHACFSQYDIVHYHTLGPSLFSFLPRLFGKKTIVTVQGLDWQRKKWGWFARRILKLAEWASAKLPDKTIVVSRVLQSYYGSRYSTQPIYMPNGTQPRERQNRGHLAMLGLAPSSYVLFLGRFSPEKNCHLLIEAFERTSTALKLVFAGGSSYTDDYVASLRRHESGRIMFLNWLSGDILADVITNAGLFVLPSDMEGMSLALLEAMGAGLCVLASDTPENCEVIQDVGFTFRRADVADLQRMLELLLSEPELRDSTGIRAQARVRQHYLWENVTKEIATIYSEMMQPHSEETMAHGA